MKSMIHISKYICYVLIFTFFQFGCSGNICKLGMQKGKNNISSKSIQQENENINNEETSLCPVCWEKCANDASSINLTCDEKRPYITHNFHKWCIFPCITKKNAPCPICNKTIPQKVIDDIKTSCLLILFQAIKDKDKDKDKENVDFFVKNGSLIINEIFSFEPDIVDCTPLCYAILQNNKPVVQELLKCESVDVNKSDKNGNTPLHLAVLNSNLIFVKILRKHPEVLVYLKNLEGKTPLNLAESRNDKKIIKALTNPQESWCHELLGTLNGCLSFY